MGRKRVLTERHPLVGKFNELCDKAIDLGIQLTIGSYGEMFLEYDGKVYIVTTEGHNEHQFPPPFECEIVEKSDE